MNALEAEYQKLTQIQSALLGWAQASPGTKLSQEQADQLNSVHKRMADLKRKLADQPQ